MSQNKILNIEPIPLTTAVANLFNCAFAPPPPVQVTPVPSASGGTLAAGTYYYKITALTQAGETIGSNELSVTLTGSTSSVALNWQAVTGASGYRIYRGTAAGAENVYYQVGNVLTYTDTNAASTSAGPPIINTIGFVITQPYFICNYLRVSNKAATSQTFSLWKGASGASAAGTEFVGTGVPVSPNSTSIYPMRARFDYGDFLTGQANANTALTVGMDGELGFS